MKVLFLMFHGFSDHSGISKKIKGQVKGLVENGVQVDLAYYDIDTNGMRSWVVADRSVAILGNGLVGKIRKRFDFAALLDFIVSQQYGLVYIRNYHNANPFTIKLVNGIKNGGAKVLIEIPTFPYDQEYQSWRMKPKLFVDKIFRKKLMQSVDAVVTFSADSTIFGQQTIQISNGIDFETIPIRKEHPISSHGIHIVGVAEIHFWHGFDRFLKGLGEYYRSNPSTQVYFHLVGEYSGTREKNEIESAIKDYNLNDYVTIYGALSGNKLNDVFDKCDFAIGSLGRHRSGVETMRSLKNREYAARGIPFAYAESDPDFDNQPYVVKYSPDESTIDINCILNYLNTKHISATEIRDSITKLSWKNQMGIVLSQIIN